MLRCDRRTSLVSCLREIGEGLLLLHSLWQISIRCCLGDPWASECFRYSSVGLVGREKSICTSFRYVHNPSLDWGTQFRSLNSKFGIPIRASGGSAFERHRLLKCSGRLQSPLLHGQPLSTSGTESHTAGRLLRSRRARPDQVRWP